jgi:cell division protein FtsQ
MAGGGRTGSGSRREARAASVVVPFPKRARGERLDLARLVPSGRSLLVAFAALATAFGAFWIARETPLFAVDVIDVRGAEPPVVLEVRSALRSLQDQSLLRVSPGDVEGVVAALPSVAAASVDRSFPHTLVVTVVPERPVAVLRRGGESWLVAGSGRAIRKVALRASLRLPRLWVARGVEVHAGSLLPTELAGAARALAQAQRFPRGVAAVQPAEGELTLVLRGGLRIRLGDARDVALKLAIAERILPLVEPGTAYVDVSLPERPVAGTNLTELRLR